MQALAEGVFPKVMDDCGSGYVSYLKSIQNWPYAEKVLSEDYFGAQCKSNAGAFVQITFSFNDREDKMKSVENSK